MGEKILIAVDDDANDDDDVAYDDYGEDGDAYHYHDADEIEDVMINTMLMIVGSMGIIRTMMVFL